ncbi:Kelch motif family protein [Tritrichomonas foetus]|uniref:Kelch motif family protein n=1 Tax=Tritrichomonas foetus TaxID=1144522 RepID=A0A1J4KUW5_9EUKA|nr:Kelch motif family protein [Tritrichomonas foetus]|eukprot:OHT15089.1 Kelch motif family protein [Tritrichomonas foetus]
MQTEIGVTFPQPAVPPRPAKQINPKIQGRRLSSYNQNIIQQPQSQNMKFRWIENNTMLGTPPYERAGHSAILTSSKELIIYGGHDASNNKLNDLVIYNMQTNFFNNAVPMNKLIVLHKGKLELHSNYKFGDKVPFSPQQELTPPPPPRAYHTAVLKDSFMIVFGGCPAEIEGPLYFLHLPTKTWLKFVTPNCPSEVKIPRSHHTANMNGDEMLIYGGINGVTPLSSLISFNTNKFKWTLISNKLPAVCKHSSFIKDEILYIIGGATENGNNNFLAIDIKSGTVLQNGASAFPQLQLNLRLLATAYDPSRNWLYIFGGFCVENDETECGCTDKLYIIDMNKKTYGYINSPLLKCPSPRCGHTMVLAGNNLVVFGGCDRLPLLNGEWVFCDFSNTINIFQPPPPDVDVSQIRDLIKWA